MLLGYLTLHSVWRKQKNGPKGTVYEDVQSY